MLAVLVTQKVELKEICTEGDYQTNRGNEELVFREETRKNLEEKTMKPEITLNIRTFNTRERKKLCEN